MVQVLSRSLVALLRFSLWLDTGPVGRFYAAVRVGTFAFVMGWIVASFTALEVAEVMTFQSGNVYAHHVLTEAFARFAQQGSRGFFLGAALLGLWGVWSWLDQPRRLAATRARLSRLVALPATEA